LSASDWDADTIGQIYEAAFFPERWVSTLDRIASLTDHDGGMVIIGNSAGVSFAASERFAPAISFLTECGLIVDNSLWRRTVAKKCDGFVTEEDLFDSLDEWIADPLHRMIARRFDVNFGTGTIFAGATGTQIAIRFTRRMGGEPTTRQMASRLDLLRPALIHATTLGLSQRRERANELMIEYDAAGLAAAALTAKGRIITCNSSFCAYSDLLRPAAHGKLSITDHDLNRRLTEALAAVSEASHARSIPVPARDGRPPLVVDVIPIFRQARDLFSEARHLLLVTPVRRPQTPSASLLQGLFALTFAEADSALRLFAGATVAEVAAHGGVEEDTIRKRLRSIFAKTGASRQSDLIALLSTVSAVPRNTPTRSDS